MKIPFLYQSVFIVYFNKKDDELLIDIYSYMMIETTVTKLQPYSARLFACCIYDNILIT